jgi:hypothetical protein
MVSNSSRIYLSPRRPVLVSVELPVLVDKFQLSVKLSFLVLKVSVSVKLSVISLENSLVIFSVFSECAHCLFLFLSQYSSLDAANIAS